MADCIVTVGSRFPEFSKKALVSLEKGQEFRNLTNRDIDGRWAVIFWWPKDFSAVCPTEIAEFNKNFSGFTARETILIGASTDTEYAHHAWRSSHKDLKDLQFPMIADTSKSLAEQLGILSTEEKVAYRATYIIDPEGIIRWLSINDLSVGRNVAEVLRVLDALQTDELCPCNWNKGDETLHSQVG